jgi:hypothetical protein
MLKEIYGYDENVARAILGTPNTKVSLTNNQDNDTSTEE